MTTASDILKLTKQLLPTGRAWKLPENSVFRKLFYALGKSEMRAFNFAKNILNRVLPDNDNFTSDDATEWERRLSINAGSGYVPLTMRKNNIARKMAFPGGFLNRQNYLYIESQLQLAGFDVTVSENDSELESTTATVHDDTDTIHGVDVHGSSVLVNDLVANSIDKGELFYVDTYKRCFYIDGNVPINAIKSFRLLVLTLKPADTVALLRLNYTNEKVLSFMGGELFGTIEGGQLGLVNAN